MTSLQLNVLGRFEARLPSGSIISLPTRKAETLLTYLVLVPGPHTRDQLANLLWSERNDDQARNSLRQSLSSIKKAFDGVEASPLQIERTTINVNAQSIEIDAIRLADLIKEKTPQTISLAVKLYRGEFLEGIVLRDPNGEEWLAGERDRFRRMAIQAFENLLDIQLETGELEGADATGERLVSIDSLNESAWRKLMQVYAARGDRSHALLAYKRCLDVLQKELGVEPTHETTDLQSAIRDGSATRRDSNDLPGSMTTFKPAPAVAAGLPIPAVSEKPSVVVLPFTSPGAKPDNEYFADGLTDDIIADLSRYRELFVIHADTAFAYREDSNDSVNFANQLGVEYVVKGTIRQSSERIRISAQLIGTATGKTIWAERFDRKFEDIFTLEDEVAARIATSLVSHIEDESSARARLKHSDNLTAFDCVLRARKHALSYDEDENQSGRKLLEQALKLDPEYSAVYAYLAWSQVIESDTDWCTSRPEALEQAVTLARKAISLDEFDSNAHIVLGWAHLNQKKFDLAEVHLDRAIVCNPNNYDAFCIKSWLLAFTGRASEVTVCGATALHLNPLAPDDCLLGMIIAHYTEDRYEEALKMLARVQEASGDSEAWRAACLAQLGRDKEARTAAANATELGGDFIHRQNWLDTWAFENPVDLEHFIDGLRKAGVIR